MKIAITGVSSTGKTTLAKELSSRLNIPFVKEGCNEAFAWCEFNGISLSTTDFSKMTARDHFEFEKALGNARLCTEQGIESFVADGDPLLWCSYVSMKAPLQIPDVEIESLFKFFYRLVDRYDYIWYCPFGKFPIVSDGYRIDNRYFLEVQDAVLQRHIKNYMQPFNHKCKIITLESVFCEYRIDEIMRVIENHA